MSRYKNSKNKVHWPADSAVLSQECASALEARRTRTLGPLAAPPHARCSSARGASLSFRCRTYLETHRTLDLVVPSRCCSLAPSDCTLLLLVARAHLTFATAKDHTRLSLKHATPGARSLTLGANSNRPSSHACSRSHGRRCSCDCKRTLTAILPPLHHIVQSQPTTVPNPAHRRLKRRQL